MQIQYYRSAWDDIRNSPGWFGKFCLLALLNFIPVFGQIVTFAYLFGWAREIAWGTHEPMPEKIFSNEDGKFWRRGWFVFVLTLVFALVPSLVMSIGNTMQGIAISVYANDVQAVQNPFLAGIGGLISLIGFLAVLVAMVLSWVGSMRISIYDRLSSGFQLGKIWRMSRHDPKGLLRIFGMYVLVSLIIGIVLSIVFFVFTFIVAAAGVAGLVGAGYSYNQLQHLTDAQALQLFMRFVSSAGVVGILSLLVATFLTSLATVYTMALYARAMGYWTMQFDVPRWGGQDDPLPFERAVAPPPVPAGYYTPSAQQPASPFGDEPRPAAPAGPAVPVAPIVPDASLEGGAQPEPPIKPVAQAPEPPADVEPAADVLADRIESGQDALDEAALVLPDEGDEGVEGGADDERDPQGE